MSADRRRALGMLLLPATLGACSWFTDFKRQPIVNPWETRNDSIPPRGQPQFSVPVQGTMAPAFAVSYTALPDSFAALANPVAGDARSAENGRKLYQINCAVCHGRAGASMPLMKYAPIAPPPIGRGGRELPDGYIFGIIRNGRGVMPSYARIEESERWDIANYLRALRAGTADTLPAGLPGETGATLPHYSEYGPTRPAPYYKHIGMQAGAAQRATAPAAPPAAADSAAAPAVVPGAQPAPAAGATSAARPAPRRDTTSTRGQQP